MQTQTSGAPEPHPSTSSSPSSLPEVATQAQASPTNKAYDASTLVLQGYLRDRFGPPPADLATIFAAEQRAISTCMKARGFYRPEIPPFDYTQERPPFYLARSRNFMASHGFLPPPDPATVVSDAEKSIVATAASDPAFERAITGGDEPMSGCNAEASRAAFGQLDVFDSMSKLDEDDQNLYQIAIADPNVKALEADWVRCMSGRGFAYASLDTLIDVAWPEPRPSVLETSTAIANWDCLTAVHYRETLSTTYVELSNAYAEAHRGELLGLSEQMTTIVESAKQYLESHPS